MTAALRVRRHAAEPRLVVQGGDTALGVLAQVIGLRRVRVAAERALRLRLLSSGRSILLAELLLVLAILLAVVVVGMTARVVRRVVGREVSGSRAESSRGVGQLGRLLGLESIKLRLRGGRRALVETAEARSALLGGMAETAEWLSGGNRGLRCNDALATRTSDIS